MFKNRYPGKCATCSCGVAKNAGWCRKERGRFVTYCDAHAPQAKPAVVTSRTLTADGKVIMPYEPQNIDLCRSFPGAKFVGARDGGPFWSVSLAQADRRRVLEIAAELKLDVAAELQEVALSRTANVAANRESGKGHKPYPFQVEGIDWLAKGDSRLLADDMGLGKTVQTLCSIPQDMGAVIVVPASVKYNWQDEAKDWRPDLTVTVLEGRGSFRWPEANEAIVTNFDILPEWLAPNVPNKRKFWVKDMDHVDVADKARAKNTVLVIDEAHKVSNPKTLRSKRINGLVMLCAKAWALTGTPMKNRPEQLYGMLDVLEMAYPVFRGWKNFVRLMNGRKGRWGGYTWGEPEEIVPSLMRRVMLRRTKGEVLPDLPGKVRRNLRVNGLSKRVEKQMDELWQVWGSFINDQLNSDKPKLPPFEDFSALRAELAKSRIPAMIEYIENCEEQDTPLVVFSAHTECLREAAKRDGWELIDGSVPNEKRTAIVRAFQAGELKGVACSILAAGVGLTLTHASNMLFVDLQWNPADNHQAEDRCCRIGQEADSIQIDRFVSNHPLDLHIMSLIDWKVSMIESTVERDLKGSSITPVAAGGDTTAESSDDFEARQRATVDADEAETSEITAWLNAREPVAVDADIPF